MTDYVKAIADITNPYFNEASRLAENLRKEATINDGVIRWNSNDRVPPADCVALAVYLEMPVDVAKCDTVRDAEMTAFLEAYRKVRANRPISEEERAEARAAHGPGVTIVNAITGQKFTT